MEIIKINSESTIENIAKEKDGDIVIYGAGNYGSVTEEYLKTKYNTQITNYVISDDYITGSDFSDNIKIKKLSEQHTECILIIAVSEQKQSELIKNAQNRGFKQAYVMLNDFFRYMQSELNSCRLEPSDELGFEVHITEHCNLNCKGCYHFSPLAKEDYLDVSEYEKDLIRISEICKYKISRITLLGGEPLLHPNLISFIRLARKHCNPGSIEILTNGILLPTIDNEFWEACVEYKVNLCCTKYPVKVDYYEIEKKADTYGLTISYHNDVGAGIKTLIKYPFDVSGSQDIVWNYAHCTRSNKCVTLKHGKIYTCPMAAHAHLAKEYFDLDMELSDEDYIDIYKATSLEEITSFLTKPIPFCRYCNLQVSPEQHEWSISKKDYTEWF